MTLRIYAKRITPLSLFEIVVNRLDPAHRFVVMEYSMFYQWHIAELARLLPPTVGIILNVEAEHIGIDGIGSERDILLAKMRLLEAARYAFVEQEIARRHSDVLGTTPTFDWHDYIAFDGRELQPFIRSKLQYVQIGAALKAKAVLVGDVNEGDIAAIERFQPKEHRLSRLKGKDREVFFDGEVTAAVRLNALGESLYERRVLVLHDVEFYGDVEVQRQMLCRALARFDVVYISKRLSPKFQPFVESCVTSCKSAVFYDEAVPGIPAETAVFFHWGAYWRKQSDEVIAVETVSRDF